MRDYNFEGFQCSKSVVVVRHQAQAMQKRLHNIPLTGEVNDMLTFEWKHDDELRYDICKFRDAGIVQEGKVIQHVDIDKDRMGLRSGVGGVFHTKGIKLTE